MVVIRFKLAQRLCARSPWSHDSQVSQNTYVPEVIAEHSPWDSGQDSLPLRSYSVIAIVPASMILHRFDLPTVSYTTGRYPVVAAYAWQ